MKRINVTSKAERRLRITSPREGELSPAFLMEALSATFVPECSDSQKVKELAEPVSNIANLFRIAPAAE